MISDSSKIHNLEKLGPSVELLYRPTGQWWWKLISHMQNIHFLPETLPQCKWATSFETCHAALGHQFYPYDLAYTHEKCSNENICNVQSVNECQGLSQYISTTRMCMPALKNCRYSLQSTVTIQPHVFSLKRIWRKRGQEYPNCTKRPRVLWSFGTARLFSSATGNSGPWVQKSGYQLTSKNDLVEAL